MTSSGGGGNYDAIKATNGQPDTITNQREREREREMKAEVEEVEEEVEEEVKEEGGGAEYILYRSGRSWKKHLIVSL